MKTTIITMLIFCTGGLLCFGVDEPADANQRKEALEALEAAGESIMKLEKAAVERERGAEKAAVYMEYFKKGLNSKTGAIMLEGEENQWLEVAYWRGYCYRRTFIQAYRAGERGR